MAQDEYWVWPRLQMDFETIEENPATGVGIFGAWHDNRQIALAYINNIQHRGLFVFTGSDGSAQKYASWPKTIDLDYMTQTVYEDGVEYSVVYPYTIQPYIDGYSPYICAVNNNNSTSDYMSADMKLYSCRMWEGSNTKPTIFRDYIPCIKMSTWEVGLYDTANHVFYKNIGSGYFQYYGEDLFLFDDQVSLARESADYGTGGGSTGRTPMGGGKDPSTITAAYIKSDGRQFIDTGLVVDKNTRIEFQYREEETKYVEKNTPYYSDTACTIPKGTLLTGGRPCVQVFSTYGTIRMGSADTVYYVKASDIKSSYGTKSAYVMGARDKDDSHSVSRRLTVESTASSLIYQTYDKQIQAHRNCDGLVNTIYIAGSGSCKFNNNKFKMPAPQRYETHRTMYLFGCNNAGQPFGLDAMRLYYCKVWKSGVLVRDFVPCLNGTEVGLFDLVESKFYKNQGQGSFTYGGQNIKTI